MNAKETVKKLREYAAQYDYLRTGGPCRMIDGTKELLDSAADRIEVLLLKNYEQEHGKDSGCPFCKTKYKDLCTDGAHDFRISGDALYYYDETFGREGIKVKYCPMCGRKLEAEP